MDAVGRPRLTILQVMQRRRFLKLALGILTAAAIAEISIESAFAAGSAAVTVTPSSGLASASFSVDGTFVDATGCPVQSVTFDFYWDTLNPNGPIWSSKTSVCINKTTFDSGKSPGWAPEGLSPP